MAYSRPEGYAKATLSSQVLCCRHYISMYLNEYLTKPWFSSKTNLVTKISAPTKVLELIYNSFQICLCFRCTECQVLIKAQKYSCQLYVNKAICPQN